MENTLNELFERTLKNCVLRKGRENNKFGERNWGSERYWVLYGT